MDMTDERVHCTSSEIPELPVGFKAYLYDKELSVRWRTRGKRDKDEYAPVRMGFLSESLRQDLLGMEGCQPTEEDWVAWKDLVLCACSIHSQFTRKLCAEIENTKLAGGEMAEQHRAVGFALTQPLSLWKRVKYHWKKVMCRTRECLERLRHD